MFRLPSSFVLILLPALTWSYSPGLTDYSEILEELRVRGVKPVSFPGSAFFPREEIQEIPEKRGLEGVLLDRVSGRGRSCRGDLHMETGYDSLAVSVSGSLILRAGGAGLQIGSRIIPDDRIRGYIGLKWKGSSLFLGRESIHWGYGRYPLLLSGNAKALSFFLYSLEYSNFKLSWYFSGLDGFDRSLTAHRLEVLLTSRCILGVSEAYLFGSSGLPELACLNPLFLYYSQQWNSIHGGNILWSFDVRFELPNVSVVGELLVDDFQYSEPENKETDHLGFRIGLGLADPFGLRSTYWTLEYTRVTRWTYSHSEPWQRFQNEGDPLGHPYGPDFDECRCKAIYHHSPQLDLNFSISYVRHGEGRVDSSWPESEFPSNNFLSGEVERTIGFSGGVNLWGDSFNLVETVDWQQSLGGDRDTASGKVLRVRMGIEKWFK